jgi:hypothetical protein
MNVVRREVFIADLRIKYIGVGRIKNSYVLARSFKSFCSLLSQIFLKNYGILGIGAEQG